MFQTTNRSSLRPKTLMSRQHSFISLVVVAWDSRSLLSKMIWIKQTTALWSPIWQVTKYRSAEISPRWLWPKNPRGFPPSGKRWLWNCGRVSDRHRCIPLPGTNWQLLIKHSFLKNRMGIFNGSGVLGVTQKHFWNYKATNMHTFGFLTGISSLTVLAWTSTSLKACLGSKNLLSILSGARKPGKDRIQM